MVGVTLERELELALLGWNEAPCARQVHYSGALLPTGSNRSGAPIASELLGDLLLLQVVQPLLFLT